MQVQPIALLFSVPQKDLDAAEAAVAASGKSRSVAVTSSDGGQVLDRRELAVLNNQIDPATGMVVLKAILPNASRKLWPGQHLRAQLDLGFDKTSSRWRRPRFNEAPHAGGLDQPVVPTGPDFFKSLDIDHSRDGEVMIAFGMNGDQLPLLNGFPCRLIVPGWYSTYRVKMLNSIKVLASPDDLYWMAKAYKIPATPGANVAPGAKNFPTVPINRMIPRSWMTSLAEGQEIALESSIPIGGIAMGGDCGVAKVDVSSDGGRTWYRTTLGIDHGKYSFRRWDGRVPLRRGRNPIMTRCWNANGVAQQMKPIWNPGGFMRGNIEITNIVAA